ncbi:MAG: hypothetical protein K4571_19130 [Deltaproteobacteria bacterium]
MTNTKLYLFVILLTALSACSQDAAPPANWTSYSLDANAAGINERINNISNLTIVSKDASDLRAEYRAGFIQGKIQGRTILSTRDNFWNINYLLDPDHGFPRQPAPNRAELDAAGQILTQNYGYLIRYLRDNAGTDVAHKLSRLLFRMLGLYHGATLAKPASIDTSGAWLPDAAYFRSEEMILGYETAALTFMDIYFINTVSDLMDVISFSAGGGSAAGRRDRCSAFLLRTDHDIIIAHNTWDGFLSQTMALTLYINGDFQTVNSISPGTISSNTDFGYNNKGILFSETTHRVSYTEPKVNALWLFWRASLAEQFSTSLDDFFNYLSLDNSGTYLSGYIVADSKTGETGLAEMSYRCFIFYRSSGGPYTVSAKSVGGASCTTDYDPEIVTADYLMGINYPASTQVKNDLQSKDNRPARRRQFRQLLPGVTDAESARAVITYTDPANPLSIFGRWDLGYGETPYPKIIPDGSIDAKVATASMARSAMNLTGELDPASPVTGFWMLYGTPHVNGQPFIWSSSSWSWQKLRDFPDVVDGRFTLLNLHLR